MIFYGVAMAEGINSYLEFNYSNFESETEASGGSTSTESSAFNQLYNLSLSKTIYPNLRLSAGSVFEKNTAESITDDMTTESSTTNIRPFIDLTLSNPLYTAGVSYNRREEKQTSDSTTAIYVNENYNTILGWRPESLPSVNMTFGRTNTFDKERLTQDTTTDSASLNLIYQAINVLDLMYHPTYRNTKNMLNNTETKELIQNGRVTYSDLFLKRISVSTSYNISRKETEISATAAGGTGEVITQLFPFSGLSAIDDTPDDGALELNSALIDGNLTDSSGINIGLGGDETTLTNMGLDFSATTKVNTIFVWVNRELPSQIANSFSWDIYTSSNNLNWTLQTTISSATFGTFQNRFEISFSNVTTKYIKVVTRPLEPAETVGVTGDFTNIFVTEIQAFLEKSVEEAKGKTTFTTNIYNADIRTRILNTPSLFHDFSYFLTTTEPSSGKRSSLSNGLSLSHRFSKIISGSARVAREDIVEQEEEGLNYTYSTSITVIPLKTLRHSLTYSRRTEEAEEESSERNSIFLNNLIELYEGISVNISGGLSSQTTNTGEKSESTTLNLGSTTTPHPNLTISLNYLATNTERSGGEGESSTSATTRRGGLSMSYQPFKTVHLFTSVTMLSETDKATKTAQDYGLNWSPFPDGTLQFNFAYNEALTSDGGKNRVIGPSLRWNITSRAYLDLSYLILKSESTSGTTDSRTFSTTLRMVF